MSPSRRSDSVDLVPGAPTLREQLARLDDQMQSLRAGQTELRLGQEKIVQALSGGLDGGGVIGRLDAHSKDIEDFKRREWRRSGWVATCFIGVMVAGVTAVLALVREWKR